MESRLILQNRSRNFKTYDKFYKILGDFKELPRGILLHIPRNAMIALSGYKITNDIDIYTYLGMITIF